MTDFDFDNGTIEDEEYIADEPLDEGDDGGGSDNPWAWAEEIGPDKVRNTWETFTRKSQDVAAQRKELERREAELAQIQQLRDEIYQDPNLVNYLDDYFQNQRPVDRTVGDMRNQLEALNARVSTDAEFEDLNEWVAEHKLSPVSKRELIQYAVENGSANLMDAYKSKMFEQSIEGARDGAFDEIKRSRGAKATSTKKADSGVANKKFSSADISKMSDDEFAENYDAIARQYSRRSK